jgi:hypothetical protein
MACQVPVCITLFSILWVSPLVAGPIDPLGPNFPDIGVANFFLQGPSQGPCFNIPGGDTVCLNNMTISATGPVTDNQNVGGNEVDTFTGNLSGVLFNQTKNQNLGGWTLPSKGSVGLELLNRSPGANGTFIDEFSQFDFTGTLPTLGNFEINQVGIDPTGSTTITPQPGGLFGITSFFDVFTEISINGGSFLQSVGPNETTFNLAASPEPGSAALGLIGLASLCVFVRRGRNS